VTVSSESLIDLLRERTQKTNVYLMYFLSHWAVGESFEVDLYFASQNKGAIALEKQFLQHYLNLHHEFPPLNRGMEGCDRRRHFRPGNDGADGSADYGRRQTLPMFPQRTEGLPLLVTTILQR